MNLFMLAPELSLFCLAILVIVLDLFVERKGLLQTVSFVGLIVPVGLFVLLLIGRQEPADTSTFNGMLLVDSFSLFFKFLLVIIAALVVMFSTEYVAKFPRFQGEYYGLILFSTAGMMLMASSGELISIYIALELTSLSLYALVCFLKDNKSTEAGLKYLLLGSLSSAVLLYGMALVFGITGTTNLAGIAKAIAAEGTLRNPALLMGMTLLVAGFGFKIASVPFQMWVPDVYEGAPTPITGFLSVASKAAGFAVVLRVFYTAFGSPDWVVSNWSTLFAILGAVSMTFGNIVALTQTNIKRMLAYSSIAHAGYIMVGLAAVGLAGSSGVIFYLAGYAMTNLGAFIAIVAISERINSDQINDYAGMAKRSPLVALGLAVALLSLTGIPPTAGFVGKLYVFNAAVQNGLLWVVIIAVLNTVVSAYYYLRVVRVMYLAEPASAEKVGASGTVNAALFLATAAVVVIGFVPAPLISAAEAAARVFRP
ncbi:MAG: NADH-quinone oxidoreductase subunit N [Dehalococcoidia bacterium]|nr:NADH-quinone oxidoreductase subunit N [Dehalococcoidia bacterium]